MALQKSRLEKYVIGIIRKDGSTAWLQMREAIIMEGDRWEILIEDNGAGFDQKSADRIFKPFERLHGRSGYEGTGMGLAICKKIVERHRGEISAESEKGVGTTFKLVLPENQ